MQFKLFQPTSFVNFETAMPADTLLVRQADGQLVAASDQQVLARAREISQQLLPKREPLNSPKLVADFLALKLNETLEYELFAVILLDAQLRLISYEEPFRGTLTQASVYPRELVKMALSANAAALVVAHNHPSGMLEPSAADRALTQQLKQALAMVDVRLIDHILVAGRRTYSFAQHGLM